MIRTLGFSILVAWTWPAAKWQGRKTSPAAIGETDSLAVAARQLADSTEPRLFHEISRPAGLGKQTTKTDRPSHVALLCAASIRNIERHRRAGYAADCNHHGLRADPNPGGNLKIDLSHAYQGGRNPDKFDSRRHASDCHRRVLARLR